MIPACMVGMKIACAQVSAICSEKYFVRRNNNGHRPESENTMETVILGALFNGFIVACAECEPDSPAFFKAKKAICDFYGAEKFFYANMEMLERMNKICGMKIEVQFGVPALPKRSLKLA